MPPAEDVQRYLSGVWRLMRGRPDGLLLLDLTADGFWNSFAAFFYAAPALFLDLVVLQHYYVVWDLSGFADRVLVIALLALIHIAGWLLPVLVFALVARPAGLEQRFVAFVVARNWGMVITAWISVPVTLLRILLPDAIDFTDTVGVLILLLEIVLVWRLTNAAIARGPFVATLIYVGMTLASLAVLVLAQGWLGLVRLP